MTSLTRELDAILRTSISNASFAPRDGYAASLACFKGKIIALDGIPCAGKTHLGKALRDLFVENGVDAVFLEERMNKVHLGAFYKDMERQAALPDVQRTRNPHAITLQLCAMMECVQIYKEALWYAGRGAGGGKAHVVIIDRPVWGNRVFEQLQVAKGNIAKDEHDIYDSYVVKHGPYSFDHLVYLYASPEKAHYRMRHVRRSEEEKEVPLQYLRELELVYHAHLMRHVECGDKSLVVIANDDAYCSASQVIDVLRRYRVPPTVEDTSEPPKGSPRTSEAVARSLTSLCDYYAEYLVA